MCAATASLVYLLHGFDGALSRDLAIYSYGGQQFAEGVLPYVAVLNRAGPLAQVIPGIGAFVSRVIGVDDVVGMRVLFMLISIACIVLSYLLARDLFRSRFGGLVAAATLLSFEGFIDYATYGPREKTAMVLFVLGALLAMTHQRWMMTGVLISLATLVWQPAFIASATGVAVAILLGTRQAEWRRAFLRVCAGGAIPAAITLGVYAAAGELSVFFDCFVLINASYTDQHSFLANVAGSWKSLVGGYGASLALVLIGLVGVIVIAVATLRSQGVRMSPRSASLVGSAASALAATAWTMRAYNNWPDAFVLLPSSALGVAGLVVAVVRQRPQRMATFVAMAVTSAATIAALVYSVRTQDDLLNRQRESVATVLRVLPDASILSVNAPQSLVLAGQRNGSRFQVFSNDLLVYMDDTWPGGIDGYARWIGREKPTILAVGGKDIPAWLAPTTQGTYQRVGYVNSWQWLVRRDVGAEKLRELRVALDNQQWRKGG